MSHRETVTIKKSFHQYCKRQTSSFKSAVAAMTNTKQGQIQNFQRGGTTSAEGASFLGGTEGMLPQKFLKICVSKMAISSILRQFRTCLEYQYFAPKLRFCKKKSKWGRGEHTGPLAPPPPFGSTSSKIEIDGDCDVHLW